MIRPAKTEDLDALRGLLAENGLLVDGLAYDDFSGLVLVYEREGSIVAFCQMLLSKPYAILVEGAVDRRFHRNGYMKALIDACELVIRLHGIPAWFACTALANDPAIKFLEGFGAECLGQGLSYMRRLR